VLELIQVTFQLWGKGGSSHAAILSPSRQCVDRWHHVTLTIHSKNILKRQRYSCTPGAGVDNRLGGLTFCSPWLLPWFFWSI
jgi:hypothetical protein